MLEDLDGSTDESLDILTDGNPIPLASEPDVANPKDRIGASKCPMGLVPVVAIAEEAPAMLEGLTKYGAWNFRGAPVRASIYLDACMRHLAKWQNGQDRDPETGVHHPGR